MTQKIYKFLYFVVIGVITIYLLLFIILVYFGPIETFLVKKYLKNYPADVVVSFTTTPYRINYIRPVLDAVFRQSIKPNRVYLNVPWKFKRDNSKYVIPEWLKNYPEVIINRTRDYGPATKLIATLEKESNPNTIIITIDDDIIYPKHIVRDLVKKHHQEAVFTGIGINFLFAPFYNTYYGFVYLDQKPSLVVVGVSGVLYKRKIFKKDIFSLVDNLPITCFLSDDLMIAAYLLNKHIPIIKTTTMVYNEFLYSMLFKGLPSATAKDALSFGANGVASGSNEGNYSRCLNELPNYGKPSYSKAILEQSLKILELSEKDKKRTMIALLFYSGLKELVEFMPFAKKLILLVLS